MEDTTPAAVLWDLDGTLVDSEKLWDVALGELAAEFGGTLSAATRERMVGTNTAVTLRLLFDEIDRPLTERAYADADAWLTRRMAELISQQLPWRPGAQDALQMVATSGVPAALVTSTSRALTELALDRIGREHFDVTVCGDEVDGHNKPHPWPYQRAATLLGVSAAEAVAVEDSPAGVASAEAAGCTVVVVTGDVGVGPGPRRIPRASLVGLRMDELAAVVAARR